MRFKLFICLLQSPYFLPCVINLQFSLGFIKLSVNCSVNTIRVVYEYIYCLSVKSQVKKKRDIYLQIFPRRLHEIITLILDIELVHGCVHR